MFAQYFSEKTCPPKSTFGESKKCMIVYTDKEIKQTVKNLLKEKRKEIYKVTEKALLKKFGEVTQAEKAAIWDIITGKDKDLALTREDRLAMPAIFEELGIQATYTQSNGGALNMTISL